LESSFVLSGRLQLGFVLQFIITPSFAIRRYGTKILMMLSEKDLNERI
jgi:hypothetical protein